MSRVFEKETFIHFQDRDSGRVFMDLEFHKCVFESCAISITKDPAKRSTVRNVRLIDCEVAGCALDPAIVEDVLVDGLRTADLHHTWAAVYKHVTLRGRIGRIVFNNLADPSNPNSKEQKAFEEDNAKYYSKVDWALDISRAEFAECDIRGIPARLIRRDPETQVVVTRAKALAGAWRELDLSGTYWAGWLELFLKTQAPDIVFVAPKRSRVFAQWLHGLKVLREAGVAEPD